MSHSRQWLIIINPAAGHHCPDYLQESLVQRIRRTMDSQIIFTRYAGHATEIVKQNRNYARIGVFGGDGTISDVVNGMDLAQQKLLIFPGGRGNGLAHDLGIYSLENSFTALQADRYQVLDLIEVNFRNQTDAYSRLMVSTSAIGYAAEVVNLANHIRNPFGSHCYWMASLLRAASVREPEFTVCMESEGFNVTSGGYCSLMVNNTCHAGNISIFTRADFKDGRFEVSLIKPVFGLFILLRLSNMVGTASETWSTEYQSRHLSIHLKAPQNFMIDGELWFRIIQAEFQIHREKLFLFC